MVHGSQKLKDMAAGGKKHVSDSLASVFPGGFNLDIFLSYFWLCCCHCGGPSDERFLAEVGIYQTPLFMQHWFSHSPVYEPIPSNHGAPLCMQLHTA